MNCKHCGKEIKEEYKFCADCGMAIKNKSNNIYSITFIINNCGYEN